MDWVLSSEQQELGATVRRFLQKEAPRREAGSDAGVWTVMADQLGLQGLAIGELYGGAGCGPVELAIVMEEMGRALYGGPYLSSVVLAAGALQHSGDDEARRRWLPGIASGELTATLAADWNAGRSPHDDPRVRASHHAEGYRLTGVREFVPDGHTAGLILVAANSAEGLSLFAVAGDAPGLERQQLQALDTSRPLARLDFRDTPAILVGTAGGARPGLAKALHNASVAFAAEQLGGAQACLDASVAYAKERVQFGRPIGSFQAIKHLCAELLLEVESVRSAVMYAAGAAAEDAGDLPAVASLAHAYACDAYVRVATENIHIHGGIGFTWEHSAHRYFKRAQSSRVLLGSPDQHREVLAEAAGIWPGQR
jgi:alkylation response protein AidB-like acyl-CoA dehydrogenase